jgi:hypothetical protein
MAGQAQTCPANSLQGYPVATTLTLTDTLLNTINEQIALSPTWGIRRTFPNFIGNTSGIDDDILTNTLVYNGNKYNLVAVQFQPATHKSFIYPATNQMYNTEDIIITFGLDAYTPAASPIISIIIPIIRTTTTDTKVDPLYLQAFANPAFSGEALTLQSVVPTTQYIHYNACIPSFNLNFTVIVAINGLNVSETTMKRIFAVFKDINSAAQAYQLYLPPTMRYAPSVYTIKDQLDFGMKIKTSNNILDTRQAQVKAPENQTTDAYKCVPFDAESQVQNGKITVDPNTGQFLSTVLEDREKEIAAARQTGPKGVYAAQFSASLATIVGTSLVIIFGLIIVVFVFGRFGFQLQLYLVNSNYTAGFVAIVLTFIVAFLIGRFTNTTTAPAAPAAPATPVAPVAPVVATDALAAAQKAATSTAAAASPILTTALASTAATTAQTDATASATAAAAALQAATAVDTTAKTTSPSASTLAAVVAATDANTAKALAIAAATAASAASTKCPTTTPPTPPSAECTAAQVAATNALTTSAAAAQTASLSAAAAVKAATPATR